MTNTLIKYLIRSTTRCTPYGELSGISEGKFDSVSKIIRKDPSQNIKKSRVDMGWFCSVISDLEENENVLKELAVSFNEQCFVKGDRVYNPYLTVGALENPENTDDAYTSVSVRASEALLWIKEQCKSCVVIKNLMERLIDNSIGLTEERALAYIKSLIKNEFLITELRPPLVNVNPLEYVISILEKREIDRSIIEDLKAVYVLIGKYDGSLIGEGTEKYLCAKNFMQNLKKCKDYIQTDMILSCYQNQLSAKVRQECEKVIDFFARLAVTEGIGYLENYKKEFLEKYGYYRIVPLMQMLDADIGIGVPAGYTGKKSYEKNDIIYDTPLRKRIKEYILYEIQSALLNHKTTVEINEREINKILADRDFDRKAFNFSSLDIFVQIIADSFEEIDNGNFQMCFSGASISNTAGRAWGRFSHMISQDTVQYFAQKEKEVIGDGYVIASLCEYSRGGRLGNVMINSNAYEYEISFSTNKSLDKRNIAISDIGIGIDKETNNFFAFSYSLKKRIKIVSNNMLNPALGSDAFRFLRDISRLEEVEMGNMLSMFQTQNYIYSPRIVYSKTVLSPATWVFDRELLLHRGKDNGQISYIKDTFNEWKVPRYVYFVEGDNKLLMDLNSELNLNLLIGLIKKAKGKIILTEALNCYSKFWITDARGNHYENEFVFSLFPALLNERKIDTNFYEDNKAENNRIFIPGENNWIYFKLYYCEERINDLLGSELLCIADELKKMQLIESWFFIRYWDPKPHIRLRMKTDNKYKIGDLFKYISVWAQKLIEKGIISKMQLETYERETERYGGSGVIESAETFFFYDSLYVNKLIGFAEKENTKYTDEFIGIVSILSMFDQFVSDREQQEKYFSSIVNKNEFREEYKKNRKEIEEAIIFATEIQTKTEDWVNELQKRNQNLQLYLAEVREKENKDLFDSGNLIWSLIHMFCNRYKGDNTWEKKIKAFIRHALYVYFEKQKHMNGKKKQGDEKDSFIKIV